MMKRTLLVLAMTLCAAQLAAQQVRLSDAERVYVDRADLETLLATLDDAAASTVYSPELRERARAQAALVRERLEAGDFRIGDQVTLVVRGEEELSKTWVVEAGPLLSLPGMGDVDLRGVLRSELENAVTQHLARYILEPDVRATSTIRLLVTGEVSQPGFLPVEAQTLIADALQAAGGPTAKADVERMTVERGSKKIWEGKALNEAIIEGRTLDEMGLRAGDQINVPTQRQNVLATWGLRILGPGLLITLIRQLF